MVKNSPRSHSIEAAGLDWRRDDVALAKFNARSMQIADEREVEIQSNDLPIWSNVLGHPGRHGTIAPTDFQHACVAADSERLNVSPMHRIK